MTTSTPKIRLITARFDLPADLAAGLRRMVKAHKKSLGDFLRPMVAVTMNIGPLVLTNIGPPPGV